MKVVFIHKNPLPVKTYGGTERIMFWHMKELARLGHQVVLIGHPDSKVSEYGIELIPIRSTEKESLEKDLPADAEIVHFQFNWQEPLAIPHINTVHGNGKPGEEFYINSVFVGKNHANIHGSDCYVWNALDLKEYPYTRPKEINWDRFLFLAKASWKVKNVKDSVKVCKQNNKHIHIAGGKVFSWFSPYVHNEGFVGGEKKMSLLRSCDALIFPIRWQEPFGIAVIEAMSQGKPVVSSKHGSMKELVVPEVGIACENFEDLNEAISKPQSFDPDKIRDYVEKNFSIEVYSKKYLDLYQRVISGETLNPTAPKTISDIPPETLLPF